MSDPAKLLVGDSVRINVGVLESTTGTILALDERTQHASVSVHLFGREMVLNVPYESLDKFDRVAYDAKAQREAAEARAQWVIRRCQELGIAETAVQPNALVEFAGSYWGNHTHPCGDPIRLVLTPPGFFLREHHRDLGNFWMTHSSGFYLVHHSVAHTYTVKAPHPDARDDYVLPECLHIAMSDGKRILGSENAIERYSHRQLQLLDEADESSDLAAEYFLYLEE